MHQWKILNLKYLLHDQVNLRYNTVESIEWSVSKESSGFSVERHGTVALSAPGEVFVPFENIAELSAINWAKNALGVEEVNRLEAEIDAELTLLVTPTHGTGVPWTDSGI